MIVRNIAITGALVKLIKRLRARANHDTQSAHIPMIIVKLDRNANIVDAVIVFVGRVVDGAAAINRANPRIRWHLDFDDITPSI